MTQAYDYTANDTWEQEVTKGGGGGDFEACPAGNFPATIVALIDVGHHEEENDKGDKYDSRKLVIAVETQKQNTKGERFVLSKMYTWSMRDNSNWYKLVCALTGRKFADGEKFDPRQVLGLPCMANVTSTQTTNKKGKPVTYSNLEGLAQFPEGFPAPTDHRPLIAWSVKEGLPCPSFGWVGYIYGKTVERLVNESKEARGFKVGNGAAKSEAGPPNAVADQVQAAIVAAPPAELEKTNGRDDISF